VARERKKMNWYIEAWKKYAVFGGRSGRKEYWYFVLFHILVYILLSIIAGIIGGKIGGSLLSLYTVAVSIPGLAATVRRLHDTNRSGWWILISLVPFVGGIVILVFLAQESHAVENQYGPRQQVVLA
jgi:uncharacterized membrane protein YhaH (DUF805 family)